MELWKLMIVGLVVINVAYYTVKLVLCDEHETPTVFLDMLITTSVLSLVMGSLAFILRL